jgi:hypothetical protein
MKKKTIEKKKCRKRRELTSFQIEKKKKKHKERREFTSCQIEEKKKKNHKEKETIEKKKKCREGNLFSLLHLG